MGSGGYIIARLEVGTDGSRVMETGEGGWGLTEKGLESGPPNIWALQKD